MPEFEESEGFKLKSGNVPPFKTIGSSPVKHKTPTTTHEHNKKHADGYTHNTPVGDEKLIWTPFPSPKASPVKQMNITLSDMNSNPGDEWDDGPFEVNPQGTKVKDSTGTSYTYTEGNHPGMDKIMSTRWKKGNKSSGGSLNSLVKTRNTYTKGTPAWVEAQNKINKSLGSHKVHKVTAKYTKSDEKLIKQKNKVGWGKGERNILGVKKDKSKRNTKTWWNPWD